MLYQIFFLIRNFLSKFDASKERGQGLVEYALILVFISIVVILILGAVGDQLNVIFGQIRDALTP